MVNRCWMDGGKMVNGDHWSLHLVGLAMILGRSTLPRLGCLPGGFCKGGTGSWDDGDGGTSESVGGVGICLAEIGAAAHAAWSRLGLSETVGNTLVFFYDLSSCSVIFTASINEAILIFGGKTMQNHLGSLIPAMTLMTDDYGWLWTMATIRDHCQWAYHGLLGSPTMGF